jgi:hypothetical protein
MTTKLTLSLDSKIIEKAKRYSQKKGTSLSKVVEEYLRRITLQKPDKNRPSIMELKGIAGPVPDDFDYKEAIYEHLKKKHLK